MRIPDVKLQGAKAYISDLDDIRVVSLLTPGDRYEAKTLIGKPYSDCSPTWLVALALAGQVALKGRVVHR